MVYRLSIRTRLDGALFTPQVHRIMADYANDLEEQGAEMALLSIKRTYHRSFKHPTGFYESNVRIHSTAEGQEVWDGGYAGPVYGPWLEGVSDRNSTSRFKGYHAFRKAATMLERRIEERGEALLYRNVIPRL